MRDWTLILKIIHCALGLKLLSSGGEVVVEVLPDEMQQQVVVDGTGNAVFFCLKNLMYS